MARFRSLTGTKGTIEIRNYISGSLSVPATVVHHTPGDKEWGETLTLRRDAVLADGKTFVENIAADDEIFILNRRRRWVSLSSWPRAKWAEPRTDRFHPGEQIHEWLPF